jgi:hypothetical protein
MISFTFGQYESAGTDYQFALFYKDPAKSCLYPLDEEEAKEGLEIYPYLKNDSVGEDTLNDILKTNILYSWKSRKENTAIKTS